MIADKGYDWETANDLAIKSFENVKANNFYHSVEYFIDKILSKAENGRKQIERNMTYHTNFQVITQDKPPVNNTSGTKGVSWNKQRNGWDAYINIHGKRIRLGRYAKYEDAVKERKRAEEEYYLPLIEELKNNN